MNADNNPYSVSEVPESVETRLMPVVSKSPLGMGWRVLAVGLFVFGCASFAVGLLTVVLVTWIVIIDSVSGFEFLELLAACALYLGSGTAWGLSGFFFWTNRLHLAFVGCLAGIAVPVCYAEIIGF